VLKGGSENNCRLFVSVLRNLMAKKHLNESEFHRLILRVISLSFLFALSCFVFVIVRPIFQLLRFLSLFLFCPFLSPGRSRSGGFTPLDDALKSGQTKSTKFFFRMIKNEVYKEKTFPEEKYKQMLMALNKSNFSTLHQAAWSGNEETVRFLVDEILGFGKGKEGEVLSLLLSSTSSDLFFSLLFLFVLSFSCDLPFNLYFSSPLHLPSLPLLFRCVVALFFRFPLRCWR